jgi:hypothetical protein
VSTVYHAARNLGLILTVPEYMDESMFGHCAVRTIGRNSRELLIITHRICYMISIFQLFDWNAALKKTEPEF